MRGLKRGFQSNLMYKTIRWNGKEACIQLFTWIKQLENFVFKHQPNLAADDDVLLRETMAVDLWSTTVGEVTARPASRRRSLGGKSTAKGTATPQQLDDGSVMASRQQLHGNATARKADGLGSTKVGRWFGFGQGNPMVLYRARWADGLGGSGKVVWCSFNMNLFQFKIRVLMSF